MPIPSISTADNRPYPPPAATTDAAVEPSVSLGPTATKDFLQELEEAASSLQSTPVYATPHAPLRNPFSNSHMEHPPSPAPASPPAAAEGEAPAASAAAPFAQLQWSALHAGLSVKAGRLDTLRVWLQAASLQCAMPALPKGSQWAAGTADGQPMGSQLDQQGAANGPALAVMQDALRLQAAFGVEHSALQDSQGQSLACHIQWKPGIAEQQVSVHMGAITGVHVPGLVTNICTFAGLSMPPAQAESHAATDSSADAVQGNPGSEASDSSSLQPSLIVSVSVLGVALGALSSAEPPIHAVWLITSRLSMHLGQIRARGRPGSLSAWLLALQKPSALPTAGLRVSAVGVQLGVVQHWQDAVDPSTLWPLGAHAVSAPVQVQALLQGWPLLQAPARPHPIRDAEPHMQQQSTSTAWPSAPSWQNSGGSSVQAQSVGHDTHAEQSRSVAVGVATPTTAPRLICVASSALELHLTGDQLAVLASVADAITAETNRQFQQALPQQAIPPASESEAGMESWLACLSLQTTAAFAMLTLDRDLHSVLATVPPGLKAAAAASDAEQASANSTGESSRQRSAQAVAVMCDGVVVTVAVGPVGAAMPAISITLAEPHVWGRAMLGQGGDSEAQQLSSTTVQACLPACDMHTAVVSMPMTTPDPLSHSTHQQEFSVSMSSQQHQAAQPVEPMFTGSAGAAPQQHPSIATTGSPLAVLGAIDITVAAGSTSPEGSPNVRMEVQSISLDWEPDHIREVVQFLQCTMLGPAVPVLPSYPPSTPPQSSCIRVDVEVQMLFGQVTGPSPQNVPVHQVLS